MTPHAIYSVYDEVFRPYGRVLDGYDTATVKAFRCPAGTMVKVPALHYPPCSAKQGEGFKVLVALPLDTNTEKSVFTPKTKEDTWLTARNKWLLAHAESSEAKNGAHIGRKGENIDIANLI